MQGPVTWTYHAIKRQLNKDKSEPIEQREKSTHKGRSCSHRSATEATTTSKCEICIAEKSAARKYRWKLLLLLLPGFFVSSLDLTVVATALPAIASHFNKFNELNWIVTAFTLTSCAFIPIYGQLADIFGRYVALQFSMVTLTIGSILCAAAPAWGILLLGRALQGVGCAGMSNVSMIILADQVSLKEQAKITSIFQFLNGIAYSTGPVIGGYLTQANWRYVFALCAGMGGARPLSQNQVLVPNLSALASGCATLDIGGATLFIAGVGLIILGTAWGGSSYPWSSAGVIAPLVIGFLLCIAFVLWERALEPNGLLSKSLPRTVPMIPFDLLTDKDITLICILAAATGTAIYAAFYFIGIYFTLVEGKPSGEAGLQLLYYVPGLGLGIYWAMFACNVYPRQTFFPLIVGTVIETSGMAALTYAVKRADRTLVNGMMAVAGFGTGCRFMPEGLHLAGMFRNRLAPVYSIARFAHPFGGTLALTVMGAVFQNKMAKVFDSVGGDGGFDMHNTASLDALNEQSEEVQRVVRAAGADAVMWAFVSVLPFLGLSLLANLGLGNVWISKRENARNSSSLEREVGREEGGAEFEDGVVNGGKVLSEAGDSKRAEGARHRTVIERDGLPDVLAGVYIWAIARGRVRQERRPGPAEDEPYRRRGVRVDNEEGSIESLKPRRLAEREKTRGNRGGV
ncbi:putative MFS-type transporter YusP [Cyphellophora attinorum]|uniref:Putative MFS-type transporter YusP n=1 Tax=Cyphellophora attinorum TaxID=1664694 RepID=A0A0N1P3P0_9EURO|nr:putative MFS-type transporter YusP [Phialophora attinorum]KPI45540.1 putative MFS-type transporter YusP [Phialophora attinorum]